MELARLFANLAGSCGVDLRIAAAMQHRPSAPTLAVEAFIRDKRALETPGAG
jgi:hypothetical protein